MNMSNTKLQAADVIILQFGVRHGENNPLPQKNHLLQNVP